MKSRAIAIFALIIYCLPFVSYAVDPIEFTQGQAQISPEMQMVIEQLSSRFSALSTDHQIRFLTRMDRMLAKAQKKLEKMNQQTFDQKMKHAQEKLAKRGEILEQAPTADSEKIEAQAVSELNNLTEGLYIPTEGPVVVQSISKQQASQRLLKARQVMATASVSIEETAMNSAKHLKGRAIAMDSTVVKNIIETLALVICVAVPFVIGILFSFGLIATLGLVLVGLAVWGLGMMGYEMFLDRDN